MLDGIPIGSLTPSVLLGIFVLMVFLGWLVPKSVYKTTLDDKDKQIATWKLAYETEKAAHALSAAQNTEMLELSRTTKDIMVAAFGNPNHARQSGGTDVVPRR